ncbi:MAG: OadG family transporter subunit [Oscillospiraceae bacterium]
MNKQILISALAGATAEPSAGVVVATGLVLVFLVLILLYLLITLQGKFFSSIDKKKKVASENKAAELEVKAAPVQVQSKPLYIEQGVPGEIVAAIAAAVACMDGGKYVMRSVSRVSKGRNAWSQAGVASYTEPF